MTKCCVGYVNTELSLYPDQVQGHSDSAPGSVVRGEYTLLTCRFLTPKFPTYNQKYMNPYQFIVILYKYQQIDEWDFPGLC